MTLVHTEIPCRVPSRVGIIQVRISAKAARDAAGGVPEIDGGNNLPRPLGVLKHASLGATHVTPARCSAAGPSGSQHHSGCNDILRHSNISSSM